MAVAVAVAVAPVRPLMPLLACCLTNLFMILSLFLFMVLLLLLLLLFSTNITPKLPIIRLHCRHLLMLRSQ